MPLTDAVVLIAIALCSFAAVQATLHAIMVRPRRMPRAERTLARRFATGDLTEAQYHAHLSVLRELAPSDN